MVVAFQNSGSFAQAVYGGAESQQAGSSGSIKMNDVGSAGVGGPVMKGGRKRSDKKRSAKKRSDKKRSSRMQQNGGKRQSRKSRKQQKGGK
jgi:hypothetical protein